VHFGAFWVLVLMLV